MKSKISKLIQSVILIILILILWDISSLIINNTLFVPKPKSVLDNLIAFSTSGLLFKSILYSCSRIFFATCLSGICAIILGFLAYNFNIINYFISPVTNALRYLPVTAFYPLLIMWFGINETMKIAFLFIATFVYMMPSVILCLNEINSDLIDTGKTLGMTKIQLITKIQIPSSLPSILNSFVVMIGIGFSYIAVAETVNAKYGLGFTIQQSSARGRTDLVFMSIFVIIVISVLFDTLSKKAIKKIFKWRYLNNADT